MPSWVYLGVRTHEDGPRGCILQVEDGEIVTWREWSVHAYSLVSRSRPISPDLGHQLVPAESKSRTDTCDPELTENHPASSRDVNDITAFKLIALHHELASAVV